MVGVSKGIVKVESFRGKLRLRLPSTIAKDSKRYISTGLDDTRVNLQKAQIMAWQIEDDAKNGTFDFNKFKLNNLTNPNNQIKKVVLYARVGTRRQLNALASQIAYLLEKYPGSEVVKDVAKGINWKRKNFIKLMERVNNKEITTIVVTDKDRLCDSGFEFVKWFCNLNNCQIVVLNNKELSPPVIE
ncbi:recombinase family protein [Calothrix sp. PCC 7507]|uniref:recombinase family protein n=1 Tax=Calothrix sp. PCC 7507 TaxID=99598 RepID=UPI00029F091C|nr:recombinase family protein [Calothrix sp. PCC 7507]AFY31804.1 Resolvase domain protein [Calothrix sp. PCC 7507]